MTLRCTVESLSLPFGLKKKFKSLNFVEIINSPCFYFRTLPDKSIRTYLILQGSVWVPVWSQQSPVKRRHQFISTSSAASLIRASWSLCPSCAVTVRIHQLGVWFCHFCCCLTEGSPPRCNDSGCVFGVCVCNYKKNSLVKEWHMVWLILRVAVLRLGGTATVSINKLCLPVWTWTWPAYAVYVCEHVA